MQLRPLLDPLLRRDRFDQSMEEEIRFHIDQRAEDLHRSGLAAEEARRRAQLEFGGTENYKEQCRDARAFQWLHGFVSDLRFGVRMLRRSSGFSILAILCLQVQSAESRLFGLYPSGTSTRGERRTFVLLAASFGLAHTTTRYPSKTANTAPYSSGLCLSAFTSQK